ncbi:MAG TPA: hypothetical protein VME46_06160 [Acidimicrobiales bacterium]|nr:hypothetical protein [Acidimicrobiales bacterium]
MSAILTMMSATMELISVRAQLRRLLFSRLEVRLRPEDEERYRQLCARERALLSAVRAAA